MVRIHIGASKATTVILEASSVDSENDAFKTLVRTVHNLAADAQDQVHYLRRLGVAGLADELALEFSDALASATELMAPPISGQAMSVLRDLDGMLERMSDESEQVWREEALESFPAWVEIRAKARKALALLEQ